MVTKLRTQVVISEGHIAFGTSGARGLVVDFTPEVCAAFTHAFVAAMRQDSDVVQMALAIDNRPSSYAMAQACAAAMIQTGVKPVFYGVVPTPALAHKAMQDKMPCIMVTGSHIPFDRNGLKFYRPDGEITKSDEQAILTANVEFSSEISLPDLSVLAKAGESYTDRYVSLFPSDLLLGKRIGIYEHSSAGRDLYASLFQKLGAEVISLERSDEFVPIDTEAVGEEDKAKARLWSEEYQLDAIFSTDGDGDRPLVADEKGEWLRGDILGLLCAKALEIEALAIPVSCNTAVSASGFFDLVRLTKIGSPYVIAEFAELSRKYSRIAGFEANGGFLLGSNIELKGKPLASLPTRDAVLPALILLAEVGKGTISSLLAELPQRYTHSDRIKEFPMNVSKNTLAEGQRKPQQLLLRLGISSAGMAEVDTTDGLRITLTDGRIIHLRASGNAPELRCYAEAEQAEIARDMVNQTLAEIQKFANSV